jgi:pimeloyl-ACP methyl ester carboxylesterase
MDRPALLVYSEYDWSREAEREANRRAIPGNRSAVVPGVGHFLAVEAPEEFLRAVTQFADPVTRGLS